MYLSTSKFPPSFSTAHSLNPTFLKQSECCILNPFTPPSSLCLGCHWQIPIQYIQGRAPMPPFLCNFLQKPFLPRQNESSSVFFNTSPIALIKLQINVWMFGSCSPPLLTYEHLDRSQTEGSHRRGTVATSSSK